ncbi:nitroreductase family protein [Gallicola sp. Sow4_E12]|uniref:nitroreductase family protein n=1 Tax=Gallicola sp. Sow4_E12 TaxID=3438785 RepID=UPI003F8EA808
MGRGKIFLQKVLEKKVEDEKIEALIDIIHLAPSAENHQPIRVWVVQSDEKLDKLKEITKFHYNAPLSIAIGFVPGEAWIRESDQKDMGIVDASIAATSVWYAAADLGLGCVWVSSFDTEKQKEYFPEMKECEMVAFMQIGYPDPSGKKAKWHYEKKEKADMFFEL